MIYSVALRAIAQATESEERVKAALLFFLSDDEIKTTYTQGYFGNPIAIFNAQIKGRECNRFIDFLKSNLPEHDLERLKNELHERIDDECILHIRFDKQAAYNGKVQLTATGDTIAADIKIKTYPAKREKAIAIAENFF